MLICHENGFNVIFFWFGGNIFWIFSCSMSIIKISKVVPWYTYDQMVLPWCFTYHGISMVLRCTWENTVVLTWFCEIHPFCLDSPQMLICILFEHSVLFFVFLFLLSARSNVFLPPSCLFCAVWDEFAFALGCTSLSEPVIKRILPDTWPITTTLMFHLPTARTMVSLWWRKTSTATVAAHSA